MPFTKKRLQLLYLFFGKYRLNWDKVDLFHDGIAFVLGHMILPTILKIMSLASPFIWATIFKCVMTVLRRSTLWQMKVSRSLRKISVLPSCSHHLQVSYAVSISLCKVSPLFSTVLASVKRLSPRSHAAHLVRELYEFPLVSSLFTCLPFFFDLLPLTLLYSLYFLPFFHD